MLIFIAPFIGFIISFARTEHNIIGNLNYLTTESRLRDVFEKYGPIESLVLVKDHEGKSRGYAFVEYTYDADLKSAYRVCVFFIHYINH